VKPRPALTPVSLKDRSLCALSGLTFPGLSYTQRRGGKKMGTHCGDVLITHEGLSGPGILDASRDLEPGDRLELDFSGRGSAEFQEEFEHLVAASHRSLVRSVLADAGLPRRLAELILTLCHVRDDLRCAELRREPRESMARMAAAFPAEVAALGGFDRAMVTAGGVSLGEVDSGSMASRIVEGLHFAGEVLDYDGDTGGFNLQAAFSTAAAAARAMADRAMAASRI
jgi:predicted Rossmann fold flavoprotein